MPTGRAITALLTLGAGRDSLGAVLAEGGRPPTLGDLEAARLKTARTRLPELLEPPGGLLIPGDDAAEVLKEREAGRMLEGLLLTPGMHGIRDRLGQLAGRSEASGQPLYLLIDARTPALRQLPWELLEALPPGGLFGRGCRVLRTLEGSAARIPPRCTRLEVALWIPDRDDPVVGEVSAALTSRLATLPRMQLAAALEVPETAAPGIFRVVHAVSHGEAHLEQVTLRVGAGRSLAPDSAARWLAPALSGAGLVMLDVCEAGSGEVEPIDAPAFRLVRSGVAACIAPRSPFGADASMVFSAALYRALVAGHGLVEAVAEGRRALSGLGLAHPSCRWWNPQLVVADESVAVARPLAAASSTLKDWPPGDADGEEVLMRAEALAVPQGFLGIEHLAVALSRIERSTPLLTLLRPHLEALGRDLPHFGLEAQVEPVATPRVQAIGGELQEGFGIDALIRVVARVPWVQTQLPASLRGSLQETPTGRRRATRPIDLHALARQLGDRPGEGLTLEVIGGPEDGRQLRVTEPGTVVGRWDPDRNEPALELYQGDGGVDWTVSRRHLRYLGEGRLEALGATRLVREGVPSAPLGEPVRLHSGDVLLLGAATRLEVLGAG